MLSYDEIYKITQWKLTKKSEERVYLKKKNVDESCHGQSEVDRRLDPQCAMRRRCFNFPTKFLCLAATQLAFVDL